MADYFIKVEEAKELRRNLLESSKLLITVLKQEHQVVDLREQKRTMRELLRHEMKQIIVDLSDLERELPSLTKKELNALMPGAADRPKPKPSPRPKKDEPDAPIVIEEPEEKKPKEMTKLERLQRSLKTIEARLDRI